ncbi:hypothetical protein [Myroides marinus]|uniref:Uncharacterized protein n=1 Tax=Myroides marinus TaxID=703342 RepID=A0A163W9C9_9FLAO|nr:hypothetical protein [Myroides marinus]KZE76043.1 hypothetical protein AV926_16725 [Myroides marinus]MDM1355270.1 hypothetical protein [Myroides marinus]MDM1371801.1 hypothetical protein [Myroides marinus]MDM1375666.1 hypothetical protein [Myroides marinus]MDM1379005.1 hypothetical protein [Myroides marinus]
MAKKQPTLTELTELLFQQVVHLQETLKQNITLQTQLSNRINNIEVKVNVSELHKIESNNRQRLQDDFTAFQSTLYDTKEDLLKVYRAISHKKMFYIIALNIFLLLTSGLSIYVAIKKSIHYSDYNQLIENNKKSNLELMYLNQFFKENPKNFEVYKKWKITSENNTKKPL